MTSQTAHAQHPPHPQHPQRRDTRMMLAAAAAVLLNIVILYTLSVFTVAAPVPEDVQAQALHTYTTQVRRVDRIPATPNEPAHTAQPTARPALSIPMPVRTQSSIPSFTSAPPNHSRMPAPHALTPLPAWSASLSAPARIAPLASPSAPSTLPATAADRRARKRFMPGLARFYPRRAQRKHIEGVSYVDIVINSDGRITDYVITESHPAGVFDAAVARYLTELRYDPARQGGAAIADESTLILNWTLSK